MLDGTTTLRGKIQGLEFQTVLLLGSVVSRQDTTRPSLGSLFCQYQAELRSLGAELEAGVWSALCDPSCVGYEQSASLMCFGRLMQGHMSCPTWGWYISVGGACGGSLLPAAEVTGFFPRAPTSDRRAELISLIWAWVLGTYSTLRQAARWKTKSASTAQLPVSIALVTEWYQKKS